MYKMTLASLAVATAFSASNAIAAVENVDSAIRQVTLYQNQAKVERSAVIELDKGEHELVFSRLPFNLDEASLQFSAEGGKGLTVLSIDSEVRSAEQHTTALLRDLQQQIHLQQGQLQQAQDQLATVENQFSLLQLLQQGSLNGERDNSALPASHPELSFDQFKQLQKFSRTNYTELAAEKRLVAARIDEEQRKLDRLQQEYQNSGGDRGLIQRIVRVQVQAADKGKQALNLTYNVGNSGWQPQYQLDYNSDKNRLDLQYGAQIQQNSNEDWNQVKLILSSARPMDVGAAPELSPWVIDFYQPPQVQLEMAAPTAAMMRSKSMMAEEGMDMKLEQAAPQQAVIESGVVASSFEIPGTVNVMSGKEKQNVVISRNEQPASAEYAFYPEYQDQILLTVTGKNNQDYPLLGGNLRTAYDGKIIGSGYLPTLLPGEEFKQLVGEDQTVSVKVEPVKRFEESSGLINKSKVIRVETAYTLQNNRQQAVEIMVYDRIPQAANKEIVVNVTEPNLKNVTIDDNGRYQQKITLAPNAKQTVKKVFTVQYPQDKQIEGL